MGYSNIMQLKNTECINVNDVFGWLKKKKSFMWDKNPLEPSKINIRT